MIIKHPTRPLLYSQRGQNQGAVNIRNSVRVQAVIATLRRVLVMVS
jgi:hypothetical protein